MRISSFFRVRTIAAVAVALVLATAGYAFADANTVDVSGAGDGVGEISGYTISDQTYNLNSFDAAKVDTVSFTLTSTDSAPPPALVKVQFAANGSWYTADLDTGDTYIVDLTLASLDLTSFTSMRVIAGSVALTTP